MLKNLRQQQQQRQKQQQQWQQQPWKVVNKPYLKTLKCLGRPVGSVFLIIF